MTQESVYAVISVLASLPVALAKSRTWRGLNTTTGRDATGRDAAARAPANGSSKATGELQYHCRRPQGLQLRYQAADASHTLAKTANVIIASNLKIQDPGRTMRQGC